MIGRPQQTEAAPYYFKYIHQVIGEDPLRVLRNQMDESVAFFSAVSEEKSLCRYAPEKWSIRQVVNHVADCERVFSFRALWFARGFATPLPSFDQEIGSRGAVADRIPWIAHVEEFRRVRLASISLFENLPDEAWMRSGIASDNPFTVRALAYIIAGHVTHHVTILSERYLRT